MTEDTKWQLEVAGMTCDACGRHVSQALESVGATDVAVDWAAGTAIFTAPGSSRESIAAAVAGSGYRPGEFHAQSGSTAPASDESAPPDKAADTVTPGENSSATGTGEGPRDYEYDLVIIGSGSGAFAAAIKATGHGASVLMVERGTVGGTCVNIGCVPSKALLRAVETYHRGRSHAFAGVPHLSGQVDLAELVAQKDGLVEHLRRAKYADLVGEYGFELRAGLASFVDPHTISIDGEQVTAAAVLIATGADPAVPPIDGLADIDYLTSTTALSLEEVPESLAVIGANAIGLELGQLFSHLGTDVTFLDIADRVAPFEEPEVSAALTEILTDAGATVLTGASITRVSANGSGYILTGDLGEVTEVTVQQVLVATGRTPNTAALDLDTAGVEVDDRGFIRVDDQLATTTPHIYAAGDVIASPQFVYVAAYEGALAADNLFTAIPRVADYTGMPRVTFTDPQIASVGLTEQQAIQHHQVKTAVLPLEYVPRALVNLQTRGLLKLVADRNTDQLLGAHMIGDSAGEVIQAAVYALLTDMTTTEMANSFHAYLTMSEVLKLAAQTFDKDVTTLSCCAA